MKKQIFIGLLMATFSLTVVAQTPQNTVNSISVDGSSSSSSSSKTANKTVSSPKPQTKKFQGIKVPVVPVDSTTAPEKKKVIKQPSIISAPVLVPKTETPKTEPIESLRGGNIFVAVKGNDVPAINIGLAQRGVAVIEFPSDDPVYQIHPGDENFVTVSCTSAEKAEKDSVAVQCSNSPYDAIVLRPGTDFFQDADTTTIITVQRNSGLVVTFVIVPVKTMALNANHVVINYNTTEIIKTRQDSNLAVNLAGATKDNGIGASGKERFLKDGATAGNASSHSEKEGKELPVSSTIEERTVAELKAQVEAKPKLKFGKSNFGLSLAVLPNQTRINDRAIDVIAVRNTTGSLLRLVPDQPNLFVETTDEKGGITNSEKMKILHIATTLTDGDNILQPNKIYYFAVCYDEPILGVRQTLKVGLAQTNAADAPVTANLNGIVR